MNLLRIVFAVTVFLPLSGAADPEVYYRWVDENGTFHYSIRHPIERQADEIVVNADAPPGSEESGAATPNARPADQAAEPGSNETHREQWRQGECENAQTALVSLGGDSRIYTENENGDRVFMTEKERPARIKVYRDFIRENCQSQ